MSLYSIHQSLNSYFLCAITHRVHASQLLAQHGNSIRKRTSFLLTLSVLAHSFPELNITTIKYRHWKNISNQRAFMDELAKKLNLKDKPHWTKYITTTHLKKYGGFTMLDRHHSISKLLGTIYPEYIQICRDLLMSIVNELKLATVQDIIKLPARYPTLYIYTCLST